MAQESNRLTGRLMRHAKTGTGVGGQARMGAGHGFHCDERASFPQETSKLAWARTLELFSSQIG